LCVSHVVHNARLLLPKFLIEFSLRRSTGMRAQLHGERSVRICNVHTAIMTNICILQTPILARHLMPGATLTLPSVSPKDGEASPLTVIVGGGQGCVLRSEGPIAGMWIPLRGRLQLVGVETDRTLLSGELRVTELESNIQAIGRGSALWVALIGSENAWQHTLKRFAAVPAAEAPLLPVLYNVHREFRRKVIALARSQSAHETNDRARIVVESVVEFQGGLAETIARCPGRTFAQRRQVFARLQRVRNFVAANCHLEMDNDEMARMASYSPAHFIRAFGEVFRQTPHAFLINQRLRRAQFLLKTSPLGIAEVARASGFENRCAFSRLFRQRFGMSAGVLRGRGQNKISHQS
jgi:AraC family transcriptional regulator